MVRDRVILITFSRKPHRRIKVNGANALEGNILAVVQMLNDELLYFHNKPFRW